MMLHEKFAFKSEAIAALAREGYTVSAGSWKTHDYFETERGALLMIVRCESGLFSIEDPEQSV